MYISAINTYGLIFYLLYSLLYGYNLISYTNILILYYNISVFYIV